MPAHQQPPMSSTAALERAIADMEAGRKTFEAAAVRVSSELQALAERVAKANAELSIERENVARVVVKRRRRSGGGAGAGGAGGAQSEEAPGGHRISLCACISPGTA
eukprot:COSAG06_NODE_26782_length_607_cov_1.391732_2_plen_106_part_01